MPEMAVIERDRKKKQKPPVGVRGRASATALTKESKISIAARLSQFSDQGFRDSCGALFCGPCLCVIPNIKSSISAHTQRSKHEENLGARSPSLAMSRARPQQPVANGGVGGY